MRTNKCPHCRKKCRSPCTRTMSTTPYLKNGKSESPFTVIISFRWIDIFSCSTKYFSDNVAYSCFTKWTSNTNNKWFVTYDAEPSKKTKKDTNRRTNYFFHRCNYRACLIFTINIPLCFFFLFLLTGTTRIIRPTRTLASNDCYLTEYLWHIHMPDHTYPDRGYASRDNWDNREYFLLWRSM